MSATLRVQAKGELSHMKTITALLCALSLSACATTEYVNTASVKTVSERDADLATCKYQAMLGTPGSADNNPMVAGMEDGLRETKLEIACMNARGYNLQGTGG
jgi:hypothetical protein